MYTTLYRKSSRLVYNHCTVSANNLRLRSATSTSSNRFCARARADISIRCISCIQPTTSSTLRPLLTCSSAYFISALDRKSRTNESPYLHQVRTYSENNNAPSSTSVSTTLSDIEYRLNELKRSAQSRRLTNVDVQQELWPLLATCTSTSTASASHQYRSSSKHYAKEEPSLLRAKLSTQILELCLKEVEDRRVFLWDWLHTTAKSASHDNDNKNSSSDNNFSPTKFWSEAPHPTRQMFNLVLTSWKNVITESSFSSSSSNMKDKHNSLHIMEYAAKEASSLLLQMEDEYTSDAAFVQEYNSRVDTGRYTSLLVGAAVPDVFNYSEVIGAWGQCIDGGTNGHADRSGGFGRDGVLQKRLRLEACAMKAMMELLESMEEDLYGTFESDDEEASTDVNQRRKKPPPDRVCYNIILASMARQLNPSLYEMRLVLQRMMERVQFELERQENEENDVDDESYSYAMSFFPDVLSYNALIEARGNRAAIFASETSYTNPEQFGTRQQQQQQNRTRTQSRWRRQLTGKIPKSRKSRFTSSEEEAILAEQMLEEISHISTVSVRPNIWSYNAVIKAWIKCGTDRGLQRAVLLLRALALNRINSNEENTNFNDKDTEDGSSATIFDRIARWGTSLLSTDGSIGRQNVEFRPGNEAKTPNANYPQIVGIGIANRLNYLAQMKPTKMTAPSNNEQIPVGLHSRMSMISSSFQSKDAHDTANGEQRSDPVGPLPFIEPDIIPDITTFRLLIKALERRGSISSAQLAEDLILLLEEYYCDLAPATAIYNLVLNAWSQAGKMGTDAKVSFYAAERASSLLDQMLDDERQISGILPPPNESSFLMVINAMAHAANSALKAGNIADAKFAAKSAEKLLQKMELGPLESHQFALSCHGSVVRIWASLSGMSEASEGYADRAQKRLMQMASEAGHLSIDNIYFNAVLDAWARDLSREEKSQAINRLHRPFALLMDLIEGKYNAVPDNSSFNHVIRACYSPWASRQNDTDNADRRKAWEMAFDVYSRMARRSYGACHPDAHTYTHMFKAIACLCPKGGETTYDEKVAMCRNIFQSCCQDGQLSKTSFWIFSTLLEHSDFMDILSHELRDHYVATNYMQHPDQLYTQLPAEWSRNGRKYKSLNRHKLKQ